MILLSASQIKTYRECVRKWALTKLAALPTPTTKSQALGKDVDDNQLQPYLRDGRPFDFTRVTPGYEGQPGISAEIASSGLAHLPEPKWRGLEVQKHFVIQSPSKLGFGYQGYLDVWLPYGGMPGVEGEGPVVADFKTTKSIRKWALKEDGLRVDVQSQLYAVWAILETKSKLITLDWLYLQTEGTRTALPTIVQVTTDEVAEQFKKIEADAKELFAIAKAAPKGEGDERLNYALTLPPNPEACDNYGGCPFRHICNLSPEDFIASIEKTPKLTAPDAPMPGDNIMPEIDLFAKLKKKAGGEVAVAAPAVEAPVAETVAPVVPEDLGINPPMPEGTPEAPPVGETKRKPGRPKGSGKTPKDPLGADAHAATVVEAPAVPAPSDDPTVSHEALQFAIALEALIKAAVRG